MLMNEIASAADTLELWKMVNDSVWDSLQRLQKAENERKAAERQAAAKRVPTKRNAPKQGQPRRPTPLPPPTPQAAQPPMHQQMAKAAAVKPQPPLRYGLQPQSQVPQISGKTA